PAGMPLSQLLAHAREPVRRETGRSPRVDHAPALRKLLPHPHWRQRLTRFAGRTVTTRSIADWTGINDLAHVRQGGEGHTARCSFSVASSLAAYSNRRHDSCIRRGTLQKLTGERVGR